MLTNVIATAIEGGGVTIGDKAIVTKNLYQ